jgi:dethiobiotin synthetase
MKPIFITGIGTGVGKTIISAIVTEALNADYWKPVQAGYEEGTDSELVQSLLSTNVHMHPEAYRLSLPASPHIAAKEEGIEIDLEKILNDYKNIMGSSTNKYLVIEGAGGIMVPLNNNEFVIDLMRQLDAYLILVSRNYLGSINHSLLTAQLCRHYNLKVAGWIFNDDYLNYQDDIARWSGYGTIASIPSLDTINKEQVYIQASLIREKLTNSIDF